MTRIPAVISIRPQLLRECVAAAWSPLAPAAVRDGAAEPELAAAAWLAPAGAASTAPCAGAAAAGEAASVTAMQAAAISMRAGRRRRAPASGCAITSQRTVAGDTRSTQQSTPPGRQERRAFSRGSFRGCPKMRSFWSAPYWRRRTSAPARSGEQRGAYQILELRVGDACGVCRPEPDGSLARGQLGMTRRETAVSVRRYVQ